jgi:hypothetical protein
MVDPRPIGGGYNTIWITNGRSGRSPALAIALPMVVVVTKVSDYKCPLIPVASLTPAADLVLPLSQWSI